MTANAFKERAGRTVASENWAFLQSDIDLWVEMHGHPVPISKIFQTFTVFADFKDPLPSLTDEQIAFAEASIIREMDKVIEAAPGYRAAGERGLVWLRKPYFKWKEDSDRFPRLNGICKVFGFYHPSPLGAELDVSKDQVYRHGMLSDFVKEIEDELATRPTPPRSEIDE